MNPCPKISILLPVFNAAKYVTESVESLLAQTCGDFELILIDDGSTDGSLAILEGLARRDGRIQILSRPNTGIVGALNDGLAVARGEYIARMDADDLSRPERLEIQLSYLESHPDIVAIGSGVCMIDPCGRPLKDFNVCTDPQELRRRIVAIEDIGLIHPTLMARCAVLQRLGGYRPQYNLVEDFDLFFRLLDQGELGNVPEILLDYRQHRASTNAKKHHVQRSLMLQCLAEHRQRWNLPPLESPLAPPLATLPGAERIQWAYWAVEGGHHATALRHALAACLRSRLAPDALKCLHYVGRTVITRKQPL